MKYDAVMHTDTGIVKTTNQDSLCVRTARNENGTILLAVLCDGMGGLAKGEVASGTLVNAFSKWFEQELPQLINKADVLSLVQAQWEQLIQEQNKRIYEYGKRNHLQLGTTATVSLFLDDGEYLIAHVGDTRAYRINNSDIEILTEDQTLVANEVRHGRLSIQQAEQDPRRNILLQCVGATQTVKPQYIQAKCRPQECYMLCSDGFRHELTSEEIRQAFAPQNNPHVQAMKEHAIKTVECNKERQEQDNISLILIKTR